MGFVEVGPEVLDKMQGFVLNKSGKAAYKDKKASGG